MSLLCQSIHRLWALSGRRSYRQFYRALNRVEEKQNDLLLSMIRANQTTQFGKVYNFAQIRSIEDFQARVPLTDYEDYRSAIEQIAQGDDAVLTAEPVQLFEPTSGSTSESKFIPYTQRLQREFQRGITPWIISTFKHYPTVMRGRSYWSITPSTPLPPYGKIPVGFDEDAAYLGCLSRRLFDRVSVKGSKPGSTKPEAWKIETMLHLLVAEDLTLISVWSPTFLIGLFDLFEANIEQILERLANEGHRGRVLSIRAQCPVGAPPHYDRIWPQLVLISCWTHGASHLYAGHLQSRLPGVTMQPKGLIATEAFISLPFKPGMDPVLSVMSHFFEFKDSRRKTMHLAHQLEKDRLYEVIVTTGGGLVRYTLNDQVLVTGHLGQAPLLRFIGRTDHTSDRFGEKLNVCHVKRCLDQAMVASEVEPTFQLIAPVDEKSSSYYALFIAAGAVGNETLQTMGQTIEASLQANYHYRHCREIGQLEPLRVFRINDDTYAPMGIYEQTLQARGLRQGDIKPPLLDRETGWEARLEGSFL